MNIDNPIFVERIRDHEKKLIAEAQQYNHTTISLTHCNSKLLDWQTTERPLTNVLDGSTLAELGIECKKMLRIPLCSVYYLHQSGLLITLNILHEQQAFRRADTEWAPVFITTDSSPLSIIYHTWADYVNPELN